MDLSKKYKKIIVDDSIGVGNDTPNAPLEVTGEARLTNVSDMGTNDESLVVKKYVDDNVSGLTTEQWVTDNFLSASTSLSGLTDVTLTNPTTDQALVYDGTEWVNSAITSGGITGSYWTSGSTGNGSITTIGNKNNNGDATGDLSTASGYYSTASGYVSTASGYQTTASGAYSHSEGFTTLASNNSAHAEGSNTTASGDVSHSEGTSTTASGSASHSEGRYTKASGNYSHSGGFGQNNWNVLASGDTSFNHSKQESTSVQYGAYADNSAILGGVDNKTEAAATNSVVLGGNNLLATEANRVYVDKFNIKTLSGGTSVNNLGIDADGNIMVGSAGGGATSLSGLTDVTLTSPTTDQALVYNGTEWINSAITSGSGGDNLYNIDGMLADNRIVDLTGKTLKFKNDDGYGHESYLNLSKDLMKAYVTGYPNANSYMSVQGSNFYAETHYISTTCFVKTYVSGGANGYAQLGTNRNSIQFNSNLSNASATVTCDNHALNYAADYSANYTDRSLVDKEYVDNHGGAQALSGLTDVTISAVTNYDTLAYNSATTQWENVDAMYVDVNSPISGDTLIYDGSVWKNSTSMVGETKIVMGSPNGTQYYLSVDNSGNLVTTPV